MTEIVQREASSCNLNQLTQKLIPEVIGREIEKATQGIYPLQNVSLCIAPVAHVVATYISAQMELIVITRSISGKSNS